MEGKRQCEEWDAQMASIHSKVENDFIATLYDPKIHGTGYVWFRIGAISDALPNFYWLDSSLFNYTNWAPGSPSSSALNFIIWYSLNISEDYREWKNSVDYDRFSVCKYAL